MKKLKDVEDTRKEYHAKPMANTVHRSSLLVAQLPGTDAQISFLNHFLLKRNNQNVTCKLTALDSNGHKIHTESFKVIDAKVYQISLTDLFPSEFHSCIVEFFSDGNLFIPYPAVMVNHIGSNFINTVHAYNRILNDVFEDDAINSSVNKEAHIDVRMDDEFDTFVLFSNGAMEGEKSLEIELADRRQSVKTGVSFSTKRLSHHWISLKSLFPNFKTENNQGAILKVLQPKQALFYGRVFAGQAHRDGAFSGNHSYYDCLDNPEYWDDASTSFGTFPFLPTFQNGIHIYPLAAPGKLKVTVQLQNEKGEKVVYPKTFELVSPSREFLDISINEIAKTMGIPESELTAFAVEATPTEGNAPTRIGNQAIYTKGKLAASINSQFANDNVFYAKKKHLVWGQTVLGAGFESWLGITSAHQIRTPTDLNVTFYSTMGELARKTYNFSKGAIRMNIEKELNEMLGSLDLSKAHCIWYAFETDCPEVTAYTVTNHKESLHCSGEHSF